jgi:hypothetical protein
MVWLAALNPKAVQKNRQASPADMRVFASVRRAPCLNFSYVIQSPVPNILVDVNPLYQVLDRQHELLVVWLSMAFL